MQPASHPTVALLCAASRELSARLDAALALLDAGADRQIVQEAIDQARRDLNRRLALATARIADIQ